MTNPWTNIPAAWKLPLVVGAVLIVLLVGWLYGARLTNAVSRKFFDGKNAVISADIQKSLDTAKAAQEVANQAIQELAAKKVELAKAESELANEKSKREAAEKIMADRTKNTDQKLKAYSDALAARPTVRVVPESVDEQCERAKALGLELEICR